MSQAATMRVEAIVEPARPARQTRVATVIGKVVFGSLLGLIVVTAIPYGTTQPWWRAAFVCALFMLAILWLIEGYLENSWFGGIGWLVIPIVALAIFSLLQTLQLPGTTAIRGLAGHVPWNAISADPYQTRFFILELLSLVIAGVLISRYAHSEKRVRLLMNLIVGVAATSALFGILRQTAQHSVGFGLPLLAPDLGYAQFINKNHFAFLMEMSMGLVLGLVLASGAKRERLLVYLALLLPMWLGVVLSGSRGGLVAVMTQALVTVLLYGLVFRKAIDNDRRSRFARVTSHWAVRLVLILALVAGVALGTLWVGGDRLARTIEQSQTQLREDNTNSQGVSRTEIWRATCKMFSAHPFLGVGMGAYWAAIPTFHDASGTMTPQEAHNDYLEILASGGIVGFILVAWFAVIVVKRTRENLASGNRFRRAAVMGATIGITGVAVHSLLDFGLHTLVNALVFTTLLVIATSKRDWIERPTSYE